MSGKLNLVEYSEKSVAVYGDTKPWATSLKKMGGRFNEKLKDGAGWIFASSNAVKMSALVGFIKSVNEGSAVPDPVTEKTAERTMIGGDNIVYQTLSYTVALPAVGQNGVLVLPGREIPFVVKSIHKSHYGVDSGVIDFGEGDRTIVVLAGAWFCTGVEGNNSLRFFPK